MPSASIRRVSASIFSARPGALRASSSVAGAGSIRGLERTVSTFPPNCGVFHVLSPSPLLPQAAASAGSRNGSISLVGRHAGVTAAAALPGRLRLRPQPAVLPTGTPRDWTNWYTARLYQAAVDMARLRACARGPATVPFCCVFPQLLLRYRQQLNVRSSPVSDRLPSSTPTLVIGAGVHGLSTAWHLARQGQQVLVVDKTEVAAGASGIACGIVRNNYFQPAMQELMAACVEVWESEPEKLHYHPSGYIALGPAAQEEDLTEVYERQQRIGYPSKLYVGRGRGGRRTCARSMTTGAPPGSASACTSRPAAMPSTRSRCTGWPTWPAPPARGSRPASRSPASTPTTSGAVTTRAHQRRRHRRRAGRRRRRPLDRVAVGDARTSPTASTSASPTAASSPTSRCGPTGTCRRARPRLTRRSSSPTTARRRRSCTSTPTRRCTPTTAR